VRATNPESKGIVEHLVGYAKSDLVVPEGLVGTALVRANEAARAWCDEENGRAHTEICACRQCAWRPGT
jgi:transposase